jgi:hypothetical protein
MVGENGYGISNDELLDAREELRVGGLRVIPSDGSFLLEGLEAEMSVAELLGVVDELVDELVSSGEVEVAVIGRVWVATADGHILCVPAKPFPLCLALIQVQPYRFDGDGVQKLEVLPNFRLVWQLVLRSIPTQKFTLSFQK